MCMICSCGAALKARVGSRGIMHFANRVKLADYLPWFIELCFSCSISKVTVLTFQMNKMFSLWGEGLHFFL